MFFNNNKTNENGENFSFTIRRDVSVRSSSFRVNYTLYTRTDRRRKRFLLVSDNRFFFVNEAKFNLFIVFLPHPFDCLDKPYKYSRSVCQPTR